MAKAIDKESEVNVSEVPEIVYVAVDSICHNAHHYQSCDAIDGLTGQQATALLAAGVIAIKAD